MIYTVYDLLKKKENGEKINWSDMTIEQAKQLFYKDKMTSSIVAVLYGTTTSRVKYFRNKYHIKEYNTDNTQEDYTEARKKVENIINSNPELYITF